MASSSDSWKREYNEALKLSEEINGMILERSSLAKTESDARRHASTMRRKITILATRVNRLQYLLAKSPGKPISEKEMSRCKGMFENLRSKANQMVSVLEMSNFANIDSLLRPELKQDDTMSRVTGMDNQEIVGFQRKVMTEQDEALDKLEETVISIKHIALAVNEELGLQKRLMDGLDHVDVSASGLRQVQRSFTGTGVCMTMLLSVLGIIGLADLISSNRSEKVHEPRKDQE